ncbi:acyl-CoA dehydrogenase [Allopusillimonas soli]|uniref:Acyl-CoA dehydrogenase family protein n=1 Tax=Allopusillimonas soli TaxID=659016 RepID=A0A853F672_9BURK|nr:acyl-CoA dehydrogenase [Allopusillimonas soli]NYT35479.1 acyl-CoA dehydrogenase family protein [Allopusillimonas soli]TEA75891.1 acyl-CoA dehydrogenase [Allopusillimonas soli]
MDFTYNEEQRMLADSLRKLVSDAWTLEARRARSERAELDRGAWGMLVDLGVAGLLVPQEQGGFGESPATLLATQFELGRGLVGEPVIPSSVMATVLLSDSSNHQIRDNCLPAMAEGSMICAMAWLEDDQRNATEPADTSAEVSGSGFVVSGAKKLAWGAGQADRIIVSAVLGAEPALFLVPSDAAGLAVRDYPTMDGYRCASVTLDAVQLPAQALVASGANARRALAAAMDYGVAAICAHAAGAIERLVEITIEYLKTRRQFGRPLAEFQVLQHRLADMLIKQEVAISMAYVAARALSETDLAERRRLLSAAKVAVADAGRYVGQSAVQLHGGMGMTRELEVGDYFKRLTFAGYLLGDTDFHLSRMEAETVG